MLFMKGAPEEPRCGKLHKHKDKVNGQVYSHCVMADELIEIIVTIFLQYD